MPPSPHILMCPPDYYGIHYEINPWMSRQRQVDHDLAASQWQALRDLLEAADATIACLDPVPDLPDLVFTANAALIYGDQAIMSRFRYPQRRGEGEHDRKWLYDHGFQIRDLQVHAFFEGAGDALFCGETLFAGYHIRSDILAYREVGEIIGCPVIPLELVDGRYYHLDTCFCPLAPGVAVYYPPAFDAYAQRVLNDRIADLIPVSAAEASALACNAVVVGQTVITNTGCPELHKQLTARGFRHEETPLSEFVKAGGGAKCLTLRLDGEQATVVRANGSKSMERDCRVLLVEGVTDYAIFMLDPAGTVSSWNSGAERTYGYPAAEIIGQHFSRFFPPEAARAGEPELELKTTTSEGKLEKEGIRVRRDGTQFTANLLTTALYDETGRLHGFAKITRDVTQRRKEQERLVESERLRAIAEAMVGLAHESRNALQRSQASLERLARRLKDRPDALELIDNIQRAQDELHRLYEEVREFAGPIRVQPRQVDVGELLRDAWRDLARIRRGRKARLRERSGGVDLQCDADAFAMRQVLRNILENSLAACDDPVRIEVELAETSLDDRSALRIAVRDNGPGLNQEQRGRIFDAFYTTKARGTGLGMAIARRIIEAHQGTIAVGPNGSAGAEIVVTLPRSNA